MNFETPKQPSQEEILRIKKERTLSDAQLLKDGAEYKFSDKGEEVMEVQDVDTQHIWEASIEEERTKKFGVDSSITDIEKKIGRKVPMNKVEFLEHFDEYVPEGWELFTAKTIESGGGLTLVTKESLRDKLEEEIQESKYDTNKNTQENKEALKGEELWNQQIENHGSTAGKALEGDLIELLRDLNKPTQNESTENIKKSLDNILYNTLEEDDEEIIDRLLQDMLLQDRHLIQPIVNFRKELDNWNDFSQENKESFLNKINEHLKETFGLTEVEVKKGDKFNPEYMRAVSVKNTYDSHYDGRVAKNARPAYLRNAELTDYARDMATNLEVETKDHLGKIKGKVSTEEFDKEYETRKKQLDKYESMFIKVVEKPLVTVYKVP
ncbi:MAG: hypothetical protein ACI9BF_000717 [Candidatus Paceibacteria bacterium]|jgi:hypothetical protein